MSRKQIDKIICIALVLVSFSVVFADEFSYKNNKKEYSSELFSHSISVGFILGLDKEAFSINSSNATLKNKNKIFSKLFSNSFFCLNFSPWLLQGVSFGFGKYDMGTEQILILHYHKWKDYLATGLLTRVNIFRSKSRKGFFWLASVGLDYTIRPLVYFNVEGHYPDEKEYIKETFPNIVFGCGYSINISKDSYLRFSLDGGIKILITNLNISYCF